MATDDAALLQLAKAALFQWDIPAPQIELVSVSENRVYRVESSSGKVYALRIHRPGYHTLAELNSELDWTTALHEAGVSVPAPIRTRDGEGYATLLLPGTQETRDVGVIEWVDGNILGSTLGDEATPDAVAESYNKVGRMLASMHNQAAGWSLPAGFKRHSLDADGFMGEAPFWGAFWENPSLTSQQKELFLEARSAIYQRLLDLRKPENLYSMIHADLHPHNIMVTDRGFMAIDFDDAGFGWHHYDLAVALFNHWRRPNYEVFVRSLLAGYREVRSFSHDDEAHLTMFLLIRALALLGWVDQRRELDHSDFEPTLIKIAVEESEAFLASD